MPYEYLDVWQNAFKTHAAIIRKIKRIIEDPKAPLPVRKICEEAGVFTDYLVYRYPVLYKEEKNLSKRNILEQFIKIELLLLITFLVKGMPRSQNHRNKLINSSVKKMGFPNGY